MKELFIIGSGGFSKQVIEIVENINLFAEEFKLIGIIDDNKNLIGKSVLGYEIIGDTDYLKEYCKMKNVCGVIAIADGETRKELSLKLNNVEWVNLVHPNAIVSKYIEMGHGNIICAGVIINPDFKMGNHNHINIGSTLGHDITIFDYVTIMPGSRISGNILIKENCMIGAGAIILQGKTIEKAVVVGAGSVVTKDITNPGLVVVGNPARKLKMRAEHDDKE